MPDDKQRIEDRLADALAESCSLRPVREYVFNAHRLWRFDLAYPTLKLAIEINGRHHLKHGQHRKDAEKWNAATAAGWRVLIYPASSVLTKCRFDLIVEQISRVVCGVVDEQSDSDPLTGKRAA